jgi:hypothetical protein
MPAAYRSFDTGSRFKQSLFIGVVCSLLIFLLVPITQLLRQPEKPDAVIESIERAPPPPPPPIEEEPEVPEVEEAPPPPELNLPPPSLTLEQLELSLNPGIGGDLTFDSRLNFDFEAESVEELSRMFGFEELDQIPHMVRTGRPSSQQSMEYRRLMRRDVKKTVVLDVVVSPQGIVSVRGVQSATHEALVPAAKQAAESSRFSEPTRNGKTVSAKYSWAISF